MLTFKADDGYSYLIEIQEWRGGYRSYRIDSESVNINLGTNEKMSIKRLDISPEVSKKLGDIRI